MLFANSQRVVTKKAKPRHTYSVMEAVSAAFSVVNPLERDMAAVRKHRE